SCWSDYHHQLDEPNVSGQPRGPQARVGCTGSVRCVVIRTPFQIVEHSTWGRRWVLDARAEFQPDYLVSDLCGRLLELGRLRLQVLDAQEIAGHPPKIRTIRGVAPTRS